MWKTSLVAAVFGTTLMAQGTMAQTPPRSAPPAVKWELQVMRDGQQIDSFDGNTTVGQARTDTHHHVVQNSVGCKDVPAGSIDLARTLTISPTQADASGVTFVIPFSAALKRANRVDRSVMSIAQARRAKSRAAVSAAMPVPEQSSR